ncbi:MAG: AI-2E family transporter [Thermotogaceae bacterium]|nr:AI-2E family transporter [Thermotogaceae bacterium]
MKKIPNSLWWILGYFIIYMISLKYIPTTVGSLTLAFIFVLIIENLSKLLIKLFRGKIKRGYSILASSLIFYGVMSYSIYSIVPIVIKEGRNISNFIISFLSKPTEQLFPGIRKEFLNVIQDILQWLGEMFSKYAGEIGGFVISKIPTIITFTTLLVVASTYISIVLPKIKNFHSYIFPNSDRDISENFLKELYSDLERFVGGQMINAFFVGLIVWIGMVIFKINHAGFLGILAGITDFIPFLGVIVTAIPAIFIGLSQYKMWGLLYVLIVLTAANQIEGWILAPKILGDRVKLNWFVVLVAMLALSEIYSFTGVLIAVPILIFIRTIWRVYIIDILKNT